MPIVNMTDRPASFTEIGRIRKGSPKTEKGYVGKDLTYFRFDFHEGEEHNLNTLYEYYGTEEIRRLDIFLPFEKLDWMWDAWVEAYIKGGMIHRSDGERVNYHIDVETGERTVYDWQPETVCPSKTGQPVGYYLSQGQQKPIYATPVGRLKVIVPVLRRFTYMTFVTTSQYDIINISQNLAALQQVHGSIQGIPLVMRRKPTKVRWTTPEGKLATKETWLIYIEANEKWVDRALIAMEQRSTPEIVGYLPEPDESVIDEVEWLEENAPTEVEIDGGQQAALPEQQERQEELPERQEELPERPYSPDVLRQRIAARVEVHEAGHGTKRSIPVGMTVQEYAQWMLEECFNDPAYETKEAADRCLQGLFPGKTAWNEITDFEAAAMLDWMSPAQDIPSKMARAEARAMEAQSQSQSAPF